MRSKSSGNNSFDASHSGKPRGAQASCRPAILVDSHQAGFLLLPEITGGIRIAHHRNFLAALHERRNGVSHHIVMLHVRDGCVGARHGGDLPRVAAGRVDHHLGDDAALLGEDLPFAAAAPADVEDAIVAHHGRAQVARALGERIAQAGRVSMPVIPGPGGGDHLVGRQEGIQALDLIEPDDLHAKADALRISVYVLEPREFMGIGGEPQPAAGMPAHVLPGERLELGIQLIAVGVDFRQVVAARDARTLARGVPGGSRGQLVFLDQHRVGAPFQSQMVEQACAHHAAADHDDACVGFHYACGRALSHLILLQESPSAVGEGRRQGRRVSRPLSSRS